MYSSSNLISCHHQASGPSDKNYKIISSNGDREVFFTGVIDTESMLELVSQLFTCQEKFIAVCGRYKTSINEVMEDMSEEEKNMINLDVSYNPITLTINSPGGNVHSALFAIDQIKRMKVPVHTVISGYGASAATLLSLAGKKRYITKYAFMLIHQITSGCWGKKQEINDGFDNLNKLSELLIDYYAEHTKIPKGELPSILERDRNWNATECLERGLVDEII